MNYRFDFDEQLPDLPLAFDLDAVAQLFEERWPARNELDGPPGKIKVIRLQDTKYKPAVRCVTTYEIQGERPDKSPWETIGVVEITPSGLTHRLFDADRKLPWLALAIDPAGMRRRFAELLGGAGKLDGIELNKIVTVRYKPGLHCVFRYELHTPSGEQAFFGKLFSKEGERLMETITTLYQATQEKLDLPRIPHPVVYWPDVQLLVQPAVAGGVELRTYAFDTSQDADLREEWIRRAGAYAAALHASGVPSPSKRTFEEDLQDLH